MNTDHSPKDDYDQWHASLQVDANVDTPWHKLIMSRLRHDFDIKGKRLLEIGCGRGGFACWLASLPNGPREVVACDFSKVAVDKGHAYGQEHRLSNISWQVGDIQNIDFPDNSFDTVFSCETIEHVPDPAKAIRELARVLTPGGRLFLTTPNYMGSFGLYRAYLRMMGRRYTEEGQPINNFMLLPQTLQWVKSTGLKVITTAAEGHYVFFPGRLPIKLPIFDRPAFRWLRWFALHSMIIAMKHDDSHKKSK